ncbi:MAG: XrtA/PEP-CTERM system TPR-repeat protein PrsT [Steroidobacteraceae bacterium]
MGKLERAGLRIPPLLAGVIAAGCLSGCGIAITSQQVLARANRNLAAHHYRAAAVDLQNLVAKRPDDASLHLKLAEALLHTGRYVECEANLRRGQRLGAPWSAILPELTETLLDESQPQQALELINAHQGGAVRDERLPSVRGRALLALGKLDEAQAALGQALALDPADTQARIALATLLERRGDTGSAKATLDRAVAEAPGDFWAHFALGSWYARNRRVGDAHGEFSRALELAHAGNIAGSEPDFDELRALAALADTELTAGNLSSAKTRVAQLHKLARANSMTLLLEARLALAEKRTDDARTALEEILSRDPNNDAAKMLLGAASAAAGQLGQADMYLSSALAANPHDLAARKLLAQVQLEEHKPQEALKTATDPAAALDSDLLAAASQASLMKGDLADATQFLERSAQAAPQDKLRSLQLAADYLAQQRPNDALQLLKGLAVPPALLVRRELLLFLALSKTGSPAIVGEEAKQFAAAHPRDMDALLLSAEALASTKDIDSARHLIEDATRLDSRSARPWVVLGALEWSQKNRAAAGEAFRHALQVDPRSTGAELGEAEVALASGNRDTAIQHLERARTLAPRLLSARVALTRIYLETEQVQRAAGPLAEARKLAPNDPTIQLLSGAAALEQADTSTAVSTFERMSAAYPKSALLQADLARAYMLARRPNDARKASAEAVRLEPKYWPALALETQLAVESGDRASMPRLLGDLRASNAPQPIVQMLSGDVAASEGNPRGALQEYTSAAAAVPSADLAIRIAAVEHQLHAPDPDASLRQWLQRSPGDDRVRLVLAQDLQADGDRTAASKEYQAVLASVPKNLVALNNLAYLKLEAGDNDDALTLARKAYGEASANASVADTFGWALVKTGNSLDAVPVLRTAHRAAVKDAEIHFHFAYALLQTGATDDARRELQAVEKEQPHGPEGDQARSLLAGLGRTARR